MATLLEPQLEDAPYDQLDPDRPYRLTTLTACVTGGRHAKAARHDTEEWPAEADFILSALETARAGTRERRAGGRVILRTLATLELYSDQPGDAPWMLCTRDATTRGLGVHLPPPAPARLRRHAAAARPARRAAHHRLHRPPLP